MKCVVILFVLAVMSTTYAENQKCGTQPIKKTKWWTPTQVVPRITGGEEAQFGEWPWQAAVYLDGDFRCGGSLINNLFVLTSGNCCYDYGETSVTLGEYNKDANPAKNEPLPYVKRIAKAIRHPQYIGFGLQNDIGLLKMNEKVDFADHIQPICLPNPGDNFNKIEGWVTGWGHVKEDATSEVTTLREAKVMVWDDEKCYPIVIDNKPNHKPKNYPLVCHDSMNQHKGFCTRDFGGPMVVYKNVKWILAGVITSEILCGDNGWYMKPDYYLPWIRNNTKDLYMASS